MKNQLCRWGSGDGNIRKSAVPHAQERRSQQDDINGSKLQILNSELMAAREENEGATYRLEELDWIISDEMAPRLAARYHQLRSEFSERMDQASTIMLHTGFRIQNQMHQLGIKLENAEITAKQEALAVGSTGYALCMSRCSRWSINISRWRTLYPWVSETELESADIKRDEIMGELGLWRKCKCRK